METRILVVDDDKKTVNLMALYLKNKGYQVIAAYDGEEALNQAYLLKPDLIILDIMLPKINGIEVCQILREKSEVPIIMLTARTTEEDKLLGLHTGADDYVTKPFSPRELVARVEAVLRRSQGEKQDRAPRVAFGSLTINYVRHEVRLDDRVVNLTPTEYRLLEVMAREPGRSFSRKELIDSVFGYDYDGLERTIDVHMMNLRRKIKSETANSQLITTVPGHGYRLESENAA
jgi:two-component system alkaline phosphatase synthesis response regulator PhoP